MTGLNTDNIVEKTTDNGILIGGNLMKDGLINLNFDIANGITPTETGTWSTTPTILSNATDGDRNTSTGVFRTVQTAKNLTYIEVDLGKVFFIRAATMKNQMTAGFGVTMFALFQCGVGSGGENDIFTQSTSISETLTNSFPVLKSARFLRISYWRAGSGFSPNLSLFTLEVHP